ncbi:hypothetical protein SISNIDRAFT_456412 [Sistotremastrum niveocremeum HHB9708]|uniref:BRCT domain-containing protein n=1 Tax=Sistotremastrum niveocremeum HHB9708 TaxID=1314777 RepID=A0A164SUW0_9AGAM|nr:hypothetical protein SISNIDRAFT_456412 [Sistotremastrum niveocremeum HHB9708]
MAIFDDVLFALSPTFDEARAEELTAILTANGAISITMAAATHVISPTSEFEGRIALSAECIIVTPFWVERSLVLGSKQDPALYSADPKHIFSGVILTTSALPPRDNEVLSATVRTLGGQYTPSYTRAVTHLLCLSDDSPKYICAMEHREETKVKIVVPHWFQDSVAAEMRLSEANYEWPNPKYLSMQDGDRDLSRKVIEKTKKQLYTGIAAKDPISNIPKTIPNKNVWKDRSITFSKYLEPTLDSKALAEWKSAIERSGGTVLDNYEHSDVLITTYRRGEDYVLFKKSGKTIGTIVWLLSVIQTGVYSSPNDQLLHYPVPGPQVEGFNKHHIAVTNYTGATRDYLKKLVEVMGGSYTATLSLDNTVLVAAYINGVKTTRAAEWNLPIVNHTWLEDCFLRWKAIETGCDLGKYSNFPVGMDWSETLGKRGVGEIKIIDEVEASKPISRKTVDVESAVPKSIEKASVPPSATPTTTTENGKSEKSAANGGGFARTASTREIQEVEEALSVLPPSPAKKVSSLLSNLSSPAKGKANETLYIAGSTPLRDSRQQNRGLSAAIMDDDDELDELMIGAKASKKLPAKTKEPPREPPKKTKTKDWDMATGADEFSDTDKPWKNAGSSKKGSPKKILEEDEAEYRDDEDDTELPQEDDEDEDGEEEAPPKRKSRSPEKKGSRVASGSRSSSKKARPRERSESPLPSKTSSKAKSKSKSKAVPGSFHYVDDDEDETSDVHLVSKSPSKAKPKADTTKQKPKLPLKPIDLVSSEEDGSEPEKKASSASSAAHPKSPAPPPKSTKSKPSEKASEKAPAPPPKGVKPPPKKSQAQLPIHEDSMSPVPPPPPSNSRNRTDSSPPPPRTSQKRASSPLTQLEEDDDRAPAKRPKPGPKSRTSGVNGRRKSETAPTVVSAKEKPTARSTKNVRRSTATTEDEDDAVDEDEAEETEDHIADDEDKDSEIEQHSFATDGGRRPSRKAAAKATTKLREEIMPDVMNFQREMKRGNVKGGWETASNSTVAQSKKESKVSVTYKKRKRLSGGDASESEQDEEDEEDSRKAKKPKVKADKAKEEIMESRSEKSKKGKEVIREPAEPASAMDPRKIKVLTTQVTLTDVELAGLKRLGSSLAQKPTTCTHLIVRHIGRTEKFLCAMANGPFIVEKAWITDSIKAGYFLEETPYLLQDLDNERKFGFVLSDAVYRAKQHPGNLFRGHTFYFTKMQNAEVHPDMLRKIITAQGGQTSPTKPTNRLLSNPKNHVIAVAEDRDEWIHLSKAGHAIYIPELIIASSLLQEIKWDQFIIEGSG